MPEIYSQRQEDCGKNQRLSSGGSGEGFSNLFKLKG